MIFAIFQEVVQKHEKSQFSLDFKKISDLSYLNLYLQHILGASKSGKLDAPLGGGSYGWVGGRGN